jgi:hypothetical protein
MEQSLNSTGMRQKASMMMVSMLSLAINNEWRSKGKWTRRRDSRLKEGESQGRSWMKMSTVRMKSLPGCKDFKESRE